jgi:hypothetical protein
MRVISAFACTVLLMMRSAAVSGQEITFADLQGAAIDVHAVIQEKIIRDGQTRFPRLNIIGHLAVGPGETIATTFQTDAYSRTTGVTKTGPRKSAVHTLGQPQKAGDGDDVLWLFSDASLVRLRVHGEGGAGGQMMRIAFTRGPDGLRCSFSFPMAPENGVGQIRKRSVIDGKPIQILEFKQVSSSCRVATHD